MLHCRKQNPLLMFGCRRLDEDLKFPWLFDIDGRLPSEHALFHFFLFSFLVNALFLVR